MTVVSASAPPEPAPDPVNAGSAGPPPSRRRAWRWWRWPVTLLGLALSLALLLLILVAGTQTGLRFALAAIADLAPELLRVEQADGRLAGRLHLAGIRVRFAHTEIRLDQLDLDWRPLGALTGTLRVERLALGDLDVLLTATDEPGTPLVLPRLWLPLTLEIHEARLARLNLFAVDAASGDESLLFQAERLGLAGRWQGHGLDLRELTLRLPEPGLLARAEGRAELTGAYPLTLALTWGADGAAGLPLAGMGRIAGDLAGRLTLVHDLTGAAQIGLEAKVDQVLDHPRWAATLVVQGLDLPALRADLPVLDLKGRFTTSGDRNVAQLDGTLDAAAPDRPGLGRLRAALTLTWRERVLAIEALELTEEVSAARVNVDGRLDLGTAPAHFTLATTWQGLRWPLTGEASAASPQGRAEAAGTLAAFTYHLTAGFFGTALPGTELALTGEGDPDGTRIGSLDIATLGGRIAGRGALAWAPERRWQAELTATDLDPGVHWPEWSGRLGGRVATTGILTADGPDLRLNLEAIDGVLRGYPVAASGKLARQGRAVHIEELAVASGPSRLRIDGLIDERLALDVTLDSPDLASLLPKARGRLKVAGRLRGTPALPELALQIEAKEAVLAGQSLARLSGTADLGREPKARLRLDLTGEDLHLGGRDWGRLQLKGDGTTADHRLALELRGPALAATLVATGGLATDAAYSGRLTSLELASADFGDWRLARPSPIRIAPPEVSLGPLCLRDGARGGGCLEFARQAEDRWTAALDLERLDLERLAPLLPETLTAVGFAQARARFTATGDRLQGTADLRLPQGRLGWTGGAAKGETLDLSGARLDLNAADAGLVARLVLPLTGLGAVEGDLTLAGWRPSAPARPDQPLRGRLRAEIQDLARIGYLVPDLNQVTGRLTADLGLAGTLASPGVQGTARLAQAGFNVPLIGLEVRDAGLNAVAAGNRIDYQGSAAVGDGRLDLTGDTRELASGWATAIRATGANLQVANTKEYQVRITPDIQAEIGPQGIRVRGEVRVPEAVIRPRSLPAGTVTPSADVVMRSETARPPLPLDLDLRVILGEAVEIDAFGVRGDLRGDLRLLQDPARGNLRGDGQLQIVDGSYRLATGLGLLAAVGKPLTIEQGRLIFANTPLTNPGLLLQAKREGGDMTAGVQVLGTLRKPKLSFFSDSDPGMTQAEISNYLVTGIPPRRGAAEENRALAVGTYVAPKLYMEYVTSLGDEADKVRMRYELLKNLEVQTETGDAPGADIFFKFEN